MYDIIIKTLISIQPDLAHNYRMNQPNDKEGNMCYEILGFDIMFDSKMKPWLIEVNHAPSFRADSKFDFDLKSNLLFDTFTLLNMNGQSKTKTMREMKEYRDMRKTHRMDHKKF